MPMIRNAFLPIVALLGCTAGSDDAATAQPSSSRPFRVETIGRFDQPWAMTFIGDHGLLVTQRTGELLLRRPNGNILTVSGVPRVDYGGQGGLGDVVPHPDFARNGLIYLSWAEAGEGDTRGAAVGQARFTLTESGASLSDLQVIWRQSPKVGGQGHYGHRIAFGPDGLLYISSGERQAFTPAQDAAGNLGGIVRLRDDGSTPPDNPWASRGGAGAQRLTIGMRNPLGIAFAADGNLWSVEMGPRGGDELNLARAGANYGWPNRSNGNHYDGRDIPDHDANDGYQQPKVVWNPVISPSSLMIYSGSLFPNWRGNAFIGGLSSQSLARIEINGTSARLAETFPMGQRIREVEQAPDGSIWVLEDRDGARLLRLTPA